MWNHLFLLTFLPGFFCISARSVELKGGPLWIDQLGEVIRPIDYQDMRNDRVQPENDYPLYSNLHEDDTANDERGTFLSSLKTTSEKRALSMFARWGPFNQIGKDRNPIRSGYPPYESKGTQTRGRVLGQPLRWG